MVDRSSGEGKRGRAGTGGVGQLSTSGRFGVRPAEGPVVSGARIMLRDVCTARMNQRAREMAKDARAIKATQGRSRTHIADSGLRAVECDALAADDRGLVAFAAQELLTMAERGKRAGLVPVTPRRK